MRTFFVENFGCRAAQADGAALETILTYSGLSAASHRQQAELVILNTCTVTTRADADVRAAIRKTHRENPESRILVTGCYAQRAPEELKALPGVEWVVGNSRKQDIAAMVSGVPYHSGVYADSIFSSSDLLSPPSGAPSTDRARPNLKIQDGCNNRCSFCIIPSVRGFSRFLPADEIVRRTAELGALYREVVLTGINLGRWGREAGSQLRLADLLRRLLAETPIQRIRLSSVEPMDWSDDLLSLMASHERIAPHVHMPLQSGSDRILRLMHRKYRPRHYADRIWKAYAGMPYAAIGADVMTGFPGETDEHFEESRAFIAELPFTYLHVFTYSERPGTRAAEFAGSVPHHVRAERTRILRALSERKNTAFRQKLIGSHLSAVTLEQSPFALTGNYVRIEMRAWPGPNRMAAVEPTSLCDGGMREALAFPLLQQS